MINGREYSIECAGNGFCDRSGATGVCKCRSGYSGGACDQKKTCPSECANGGKCNPFTGNCMCPYGFSGTTCEIACPANERNGAVCSGRGRCGGDGKCTCLFGFSGPDCSEVPCPMDEAGNECSNNGECDKSPISFRPTCKCNPGFAGYTCNLNATTLQERKIELRAEVDEMIKAAGVQTQELAVCLNEEKPVLCPNDDAVAIDKRGICVATRRDCADTTKKALCKSEGKRWCGVSCISKRLRCPRARACKKGKMRCPDGSCAGKASKCPTVEAVASKLCIDAAGNATGEVPCGDGITCAADAEACRKAVQLDGCPVGLFSCPSNPKECRANKKDCHCTGVGEKFCGWRRNTKGRLLKEEFESANGETSLRKVPKCAKQCDMSLNPLTAQVKPQPMTTDPAEASAITLNTTAGEDNKDAGGGDGSVGSIKIGAKAVTGVDDAEAVITFAIKPTALADVREGSLKGKDVMSTVIGIVPDQPIKIDPDQGIEIDLCISADDAQKNKAVCLAVLERLRPVSSQDVTANDVKEVPGGCKMGKACGCSCLFNTPHLTTFAVIDAGLEVTGEPSDDQLSAGVAVLAADDGSSDDSTDDPNVAVASRQLPIAAVAAAAAAVALVAAIAIVKRRQAPAVQTVVSTSTSAHQPNPLRDTDKAITGGASDSVDMQVL